MHRMDIKGKSSTAAIHDLHLHTQIANKELIRHEFRLRLDFVGKYMPGY